MGSLLLNNLSVRYGHIQALDRVNLNLLRGEITGVIGPNGGGKSTLIKAIAGETANFSGAIRFDSGPLNRKRTRIAYVPQARHVNWDFPLSARNLVEMGTYRELGWFGRPGAADSGRVDAALNKLGLGGAGDRHISQFSGGQQQRLFLARALVQRPDIVLLDEPMTGLDVTTHDLIQTITREFATAGAIVILVSHELDDVRTLCDRIVCLNRRVVAVGPTQEIFTAENLRATFGGRLAMFDAS